MSELRFVRMGFGAERVEYQEAWDEQRRVHAARFADEVPDTVLLLEHPAGLHRRPAHRGQRTSAGRHTGRRRGRGGKITWHGPGQLVGYPIQKLPRPVDVVAQCGGWRRP